MLPFACTARIRLHKNHAHFGRVRTSLFITLYFIFQLHLMRIFFADIECKLTGSRSNVKSLRFLSKNSVVT